LDWRERGSTNLWCVPYQQGKNAHEEEEEDAAEKRDVSICCVNSFAATVI
jgi:hypothetical protein